MMILPLTPQMALDLLPHLSALDRAEITRTHPDLERWARERCALPGCAWAMVVRGEVQAIGGVIDRGGIGTLWIAGREGWTRHVKTVLRVFREVRNAYGRLECKAYRDNPRAQRFAERVGFVRLAVNDNLVHYRMTP